MGQTCVSALKFTYIHKGRTHRCAPTSLFIIRYWTFILFYYSSLLLRQWRWCISLPFSSVDIRRNIFFRSTGWFAFCFTISGRCTGRRYVLCHNGFTHYNLLIGDIPDSHIIGQSQWTVIRFAHSFQITVINVMPGPDC